MRSWRFTKSKDVDVPAPVLCKCLTGHVVNDSRVAFTNCKNCSAPVNPNAVNCQYCGTYYIANEQADTVQIRNERVLITPLAVAELVRSTSATLQEKEAVDNAMHQLDR